MVRLGLDLPPEQLALVCSSHSGERFHREGVRSILERHGLSVEDLQNTPDLPYDDVDRRQWLREGREPESLAQNCSGKHSGMLAVCVAAMTLRSAERVGHLAAARPEVGLVHDVRRGAELRREVGDRHPGEGDHTVLSPTGVAREHGRVEIGHLGGGRAESPASAAAAHQP